MHAEICPICNGTRKLKYGTKAIPLTNVDDKTCHGCDGEGWVKVPDAFECPPVKDRIIKRPQKKEGKWE